MLMYLNLVNVSARGLEDSMKKKKKKIVSTYASNYRGISSIDVTFPSDTMKSKMHVICYISRAVYWL